MRAMILSLCLFFVATAASADTNVIITGRRPVSIVSAQEHAEHLAVTNTFVHCGRRGLGYEGLGFSTISPEAACKGACYWGKRRVREIGTAWSPLRRGWVAVVRYE